ncbi:MAG: hypothetical protein V4526_01045 [Patescibacteria group bacterium]
MKTELNKLFNSAKTVSMTVSEHRTVKQAILKYVDESPKLLLKPQRILSPFSYGEYVLDMTFGIRHSAKKMGALASMAAVFAMTVTTLFAAEGTLPGDTLYSVKLNVNEKVVSSFVNDPKEKIKREAELAERRLAEAELVAQSKSVRKDVDNKDMILLAKNFEEHAQNFHNQIKEVKEQDRDEALKAGVSFESVLSVYDKTITSAANKDSQVKDHLKDIQAKIAEQNSQTEGFINLITEEKTVLAAADSIDRYQKQLKKKLVDLEEDLESLDKKVDSGAKKSTTTIDVLVYAEYEKRVKEADALIHDAKLKLKNLNQEEEAPKVVSMGDESKNDSQDDSKNESDEDDISESTTTAAVALSTSTATTTDLAAGATTTASTTKDATTPATSTASTTVEAPTDAPTSTPAVDIKDASKKPKNESISPSKEEVKVEDVSASRAKAAKDAQELQDVVTLLNKAESIIEAVKSVMQ